jgi:tight adherence protein B
MILLIGGCTFIALFFAVRFIFPGEDAVQSAALRRLQPRDPESRLKMERRALSALPFFDRVLRRVSPAKSMQIWIRQAGLKIAPGVLVLLVAVAGLASGTLLQAAGMKGFLLVLISLASAAFPLAVIHLKRAKRFKTFSTAFPDSVSRLASSLRAGYSMQMSIEALTEDAGNIVSDEFRLLLSELEVGQSFEAALQRMLERIDTPDLRLFIASVIIQRESGGNLADLLDNLEATIQERFALERELAAATAQARLSGIVLSLLPVFVGAAVFFIHRDYIMFFFQDPVGKHVFKACVIGQLLGIWSMRRIVSIQI